MDCSLPCSSIHGIFQARVLEWVAISFSSYNLKFYLIYHIIYIPVGYLKGLPRWLSGTESSCQCSRRNDCRFRIFLGQEDPLEKEMATCSSILAWKIPWTEEPGGRWSWGRKELDMTEYSRDLPQSLCRMRCGVGELFVNVFICFSIKTSLVLTVSYNQQHHDVSLFLSPFSILTKKGAKDVIKKKDEAID